MLGTTLLGVANRLLESLRLLVCRFIVGVGERVLEYSTGVFVVQKGEVDYLRLEKIRV